MRIAVVGGGVSGLVSAYLLSKAHDVSLFERNRYIGGHSNTVAVHGPSGDVHLDTGFLVYNEPAYPRFSGLLSELGVPTQPSDMSFSVSCQSCNLQYSSRGLRGFLANPPGMLRPERARLAAGIIRFYRDAPRSMNSGEVSNLTVGEYLRLRRFSAEFKNHFLVPLAAAVWSAPPHQIESFPAAYMLRFLYNHGLIGGGEGRWRWRTVAGGSRVYVKAITGRLPDTRAATPVLAIERHVDGIGIVLDGGRRERFDSVVIACHADEALALLTDASPQERAALGLFAYTRNRVILHTDATLLPPRQAARASWNYQTRDCHEPQGNVALTYHLNRLQSVWDGCDYCVSVNPELPIAADSIISEFSYDHPQYTFQTLEGQRKVQELNGSRRTFFAGAHLGSGFHEDGVASAYNVAALVGAGLPKTGARP